MGSDRWTHNDAKTVLFYDPIANDFVEGPPMNSMRTSLACTLFHSPMHDNRPVVLAVSGADAGATAEVLDYSVVGTGWEYSKYSSFYLLIIDAIFLISKNCFSWRSPKCWWWSWSLCYDLQGWTRCICSKRYKPF